MGTQASVEEIYIAPAAGAKMQKVEEVEAVAGLGLRGDRYCERRGLYSGVDECQVTSRPPCSYLQSLTQPGITRALPDKAGICARVVKSGTIRAGDPIRILGRVNLSEVEAE